MKTKIVMKESVLSVRRALGLAVLALGVGFAAPTMATTLYASGHGTVYDPDRQLEWVADANYAKTSGYDVDGLMTWSEANTWAQNLVYGGHDDWHLPNTPAFSDCLGAASQCADGDYGHLFYNELGGVAFNSIATVHNAATYALFTNLRTDAAYYAEDPFPVAYNGANNAWTFNFLTGDQGGSPKGVPYYAMAVRCDSDNFGAETCPEPEVLGLLGVGLLGFVGWRVNLNK